jgi:hypothetical protein
MNLSEAIKKAVTLYAESKYSEEDLELALKEMGISASLAHKIIEFVPLAFGRVFLNDLNVKTQEHFVRYVVSDGKTVEKQRRNLTDEPVFKETLKIASKMKGNKETGKDFVAIAFCSAEVRAVNEMELKGSKPENVVLTAPYLQWNEVNETDVLESKEPSSWWQFWK